MDMVHLVHVSDTKINGMEDEGCSCNTADAFTSCTISRKADSLRFPNPPLTAFDWFPFDADHIIHIQEHDFRI